MTVDEKQLKHQQRLLQPLFLVPKKEQVELAQRLNKELSYLDFHAKHERTTREAAGKSVAFELDSNSLVKRSESPTRDFQYVTDQKRKNAKINGQVNLLRAKQHQKHVKNLHTCPEPLSLSSRKTIPLSDYLATVHTTGSISSETKTCVRMYHQEWSGKYKLGLETGALGAKVTPPLASGERVTSELTKKAIKNILESGAYMSAARKGYTTFLTLTFNKASRNALNEIIAVNGNKTKTYRYQPNGSKTPKKYIIECIAGIPNELNPNFDETISSYSNAVPATGAFSKVSFEPKTTIGKEVSRFFDGAQKIYQRGFVPEFIETKAPKSETFNQNIVCISSNHEPVKPAMVMFCPEVVTKKSSSGEILDFEYAGDFEKYNPRKHTDSQYLEKHACFGQSEKFAPLDYMWVAEMPENSNGEKNPHVHILMRWQVNPQIFQAWAKRLERLWGHGFAKLERIHTPQAASNYLLKAVGYLTKSESSEQGDISGNRYNISASARAPKWECIGEFYADNFIAILGELREKLNRKKATLRAATNAKINQQSELKKYAAKLRNINQKSPSEKRQAYIEAIKKDLLLNDHFIQSNHSEINQLPFANDFSIGGMDEDQAAKLLHWAMRDRWWNCDVKEHRYSHWQELKQNTIEAVKQARAHLRNHQWLLETRDLTWQWAEEQNQYDPIGEAENTVFDEDGREWELVA
jgi:hypothetical protein